jgi:nucleotidyltransferase/DNA polymerase involved in DNA repair
VSILYCTIPHFAIALAGARTAPLHDGSSERAVIALDPSGRVLDADPRAAACGVRPGQSARLARIRCPQARLVEADLDGCCQAMEALLGVLERTGDRVEPHGWGAAYVDLDPSTSSGRALARSRTDAIRLCSETGRAIRRELALEPALGWNHGKFTAQAAARRTRPGRLLAVDKACERTFLDPLPVGLLPLGPEPLRRLRFLGLRTLGQYASLPPGAVWQQFGRAGLLALRCALGRDERRVVGRREAPRLSARQEYEVPLADRARLRAALGRLLAPPVRKLHADLRACGLVRLAVSYEEGPTVERARAFVTPMADEMRLLDAVEGLVLQTRQVCLEPDGFGPISALEIALEELQDAVGQMEQLSFLPGENSAAEESLRQVQRYLATRFGASCLRRAIVQHPQAPLAEWRVGWTTDDGRPTFRVVDDGRRQAGHATRADQGSVTQKTA